MLQVELLQEQGVYRDTYVGPAAPDTDLEPDQDISIYNDDKVRLTKYYGLVPRELLESALRDDDEEEVEGEGEEGCLLYTSPSPRDGLLSRMPSSA